MNNMLIIGAGGFGKVIYEVCLMLEKFKEISFLDDNAKGENIIGKCCDYLKFKDNYEFIYPAFGNNELRLKWVQTLKENGFIVPQIIHPSAQISKSASIGCGVAVLQNAVINTNSFVDDACLINCGAVVDHDCRLNKGVHICLNSVVKAGISIGQGIKVEAGEVVKINLV